MPVKILMPALSPTMTDGTLARWHVKEGDAVASGDVLAEIETDKATMEVEAVEEGRIGKILVVDGTEQVPVNAVIALLLEDGETEADLDGIDVAPPSAAPSPAAPPATHPTSEPPTSEATAPATPAQQA
ncbi:MAG: biotin/lipoyl-binding protein, partial [Proteobacteria bacterium]|nr:biotin/lipoyl-binding protein [Pseudomonadota bacterium]